MLYTKRIKSDPFLTISTANLLKKFQKSYSPYEIFQNKPTITHPTAMTFGSDCDFFA